MPPGAVLARNPGDRVSFGAVTRPRQVRHVSAKCAVLFPLVLDPIKGAREEKKKREEEEDPATFFPR